MLEQEQNTEKNGGLEANRLRAIQNLEVSLRNPEENRLREHQLSIVDSTLQFLKNGNTAGYVLGAPGIGKSAMATILAEQIGLQTVILSPTQQIHKQIRDSARKLTPGTKVTDYFAGKKDLSGQVINTTYQSMEAILGKGKRAGKTNKEFDPTKVGLVIGDEIHVGIGQVRHTLYRDFPNAIFMGMTGTADFASIDWLVEDGKADKNERWLDMFRKNIHEITWEEGIERGILPPLHVKLVRTGVRVRNVDIVGGDYKPKDLERELHIQKRNAQILGMIAGLDAIPYMDISSELRQMIAEIHDETAGKRTLVQCVSISQADTIAAQLQELGITAAPFHGKVDRKTREEYLEKHQNGEIQVLTGVSLLGIGTDSPPSEVGIFQPTMSGVVKGQWLGRVMRPSPETGKAHAVAIDLVDIFEDRKANPLLIPYLFEPDYVIRGSRRRYPGELSTEKADTPKITFSGMDIEGIVEDMKVQDTLTIRFKQATVEEIDSYLQTLLIDISRKNPDASTNDLLREVTNAMPYHMPEEATQKSLQALASLDTNMQKIGKRTLLFLHLKTVAGIVDSSPLIRTQEEREELFVHSFEEIGRRLHPDRLSRNIRVSQQVHKATRDILVTAFAEKYQLPVAMVRKDYFPVLLMNVEAATREGYRELKQNESEVVVATIVERTGAVPEEVHALLDSPYFVSLDQLPEEEQPYVGEEIVIGPVIQQDLRETVDDILEELTRRERRSIELYYGFDTGRERRLEEIGKEFGVTGTRVREILGKGQRKLTHPARSKQLKPYLDESAPRQVRTPVFYSSEILEHTPTVTSLDTDPKPYVDISLGQLSLSERTLWYLNKIGVYEIGDLFSTSIEKLKTPGSETVMHKIKDRYEEFHKKISSGAHLSPEEYKTLVYLTDSLLEREDYEDVVQGLSQREREAVDYFHGVTSNAPHTTKKEGVIFPQVTTLGLTVIDLQARRKIFSKFFERITTH